MTSKTPTKLYELTYARKLSISPLLNKISKIPLGASLALIWGVFVQNFSSLALKSREEFEVMGNFFSH